MFASFYLYKHVLFIQTLLIWLYLFFLLTEYRWKLRCSGTCCDKNGLDWAHLFLNFSWFEDFKSLDFIRFEYFEGKPEDNFWNLIACVNFSSMSAKYWNQVFILLPSCWEFSMSSINLNVKREQRCQQYSDRMVNIMLCQSWTIK